MLTNQLIGAAQNAVNHSPRPSAPQDAQPQAALSALATNTELPAMTTRPVSATGDAQETRPGDKEERPPLEIPKRVEMRIALVDTIPDAVPESIYDAKAVREPEE